MCNILRCLQSSSPFFLSGSLPMFRNPLVTYPPNTTNRYLEGVCYYWTSDVLAFSDAMFPVSPYVFYFLPSSFSILPLLILPLFLLLFLFPTSKYWSLLELDPFFSLISVLSPWVISSRLLTGTISMEKTTKFTSSTLTCQTPNCVSNCIFTGISNRHANITKKGPPPR